VPHYFLVRVTTLAHCTEVVYSLYMLTDSELYAIAHMKWEYRDGQLFSRYSGKPVGAPNKDGYLQVSAVHEGLTVCLLSHRAIFLMHHGYLPHIVDHDNRDITDNDIDNLRAATRGQNNANRGTSTRNKVGIKGVTYRPNANKSKPYVASIKKNGKQVHLGYWATEAEAGDAYFSAAQELHGEFAAR